MRSLAVRTAVLVALFAGLGYLAVRLVPGSGERLRDAAPGWIAAGVAVELAACAGFAWCFHACFSYQPYVVRPARSAQVALGELAAFALVPTGIAAPLLRFWALVRGGMPLRTVAVRSVVHGPLLSVPYIAVAAVLGIGVVVGTAPGDAPLAVALAPTGVTLVSGLIALALTRIGRAKRLEGRGGWRGVLRALVTIIPDGLREIPGRARAPGAIGGAAIWWACDCAALWAAFQAVGASPNVGVIALGYMLGQLGTTLPLPGGVGGVEPIMLGVLTASGVAAAPGAAAIVVYRAISLGIQSSVGAVAVGILVPSVRAEARAGQPG